ncbi:ABC transporter substrate-binding protein [Streptomyces sp. NPDC048290]|uniref:ABC transporter substrate-binding protein n=1 Tax=Streptomyces sp. NPDC048290 TaxID=3155811 RepID=UPI00341A0E8C
MCERATGERGAGEGGVSEGGVGEGGFGPPGHGGSDGGVASGDTAGGKLAGGRTVSAGTGEPEPADGGRASGRTGTPDPRAGRPDASDGESVPGHTTAPAPPGGDPAPRHTTAPAPPRGDPAPRHTTTPDPHDGDPTPGHTTAPAPPRGDPAPRHTTTPDPRLAGWPSPSEPGAARPAPGPPTAPATAPAKAPDDTPDGTPSDAPRATPQDSPRDAPPGVPPGAQGPATPPWSTAGGNWLPPDIVRLVADRSARALDPPPRPPAAAPAHRDDDPGRHPTRRRALLIGGSALAAVAASGSAAAVLLLRRDPASGNGDPAAPEVPTRLIAVQGDLSGAGKAVGTAQERGARLAVAAHNAGAKLAFRLKLAVHDDGGDPDRARTVARDLADTAGVCAVLGPTTTGTLRVAAPLFEAASMPFVLVSTDAEEAGLSSATNRTLVLTRAPSTYRTLPLISYLTRVRDSHRTAVVEDEAGGAVARKMRLDMGEAAPNGDDGGTVSVYQVAAGEDDFGPAVREALAADADAVVYAGTSARRAAACARAVAGAGFTGARVAFEPVLRPEFLQAAGAAADGWVFGASYAEPQSADTPAARSFTAAYRERYDTAPARWAVEAYDAVGLLARALGAFGSRASVQPGELAERVFVSSYEGVAKPLRFTDDGTHLIQLEQSGFLYRAQGGRFRFLGRFDQVTEDPK